MISEPKRTDLKCKICDYPLLALEDKVFCANPDCYETHAGNFRQVKPKGMK